MNAILDQQRQPNLAKLQMSSMYGDGWNLHVGGIPVHPDEPVEVLWPNGLSRIYERGDHIAWQNIPRERGVFWRVPR